MANAPIKHALATDALAGKVAVVIGLIWQKVSY